MNPASKLLIVLLIAVLGGGGAYLFFSNPPGDPVAVPGAGSGTEPAPDPAPGEPDALAGGGVVEDEPQPERQPDQPARERLEVGGAGAENPQGVTGRVLQPGGAPLAGAKVYLIQGPGSDIFQMLRQSQQGVILPPVAEGETDRSGRYRLGIQQAQTGKTFEVRVITDRFRDANIPQVTIRAGQWEELPDLTLERGATLRGRVTVAGTGLPVVDAIVAVEANMVGMPTLTPTPGREQGITAVTDQYGNYRLENVPPGIVNLSAVADGYARYGVANVAIELDGINEQDFELSAGKAIAGVVTDAAGEPVRGARVTATSFSSKAPTRPEGDHTSADGSFRIIGLLDGQYALTAVARGYEEATEPPVAAGTEDVHIALERQGSARLQVFGKNGQLLTNYRVNVKRWFPDSDQYGLTSIPETHVRNPKDGIATIENIDAGQYVFEVVAAGHAKAFSEQFKVGPGIEPPLVVVHMNEGGVIEGRVSDDAGRPLAGVLVETMPNALDENPFTKMFASMIPYQITRTSARTADDGRFRLPLLNPGTYQLKFSSPEHFTVYSKGHRVEVGETTPVEQVRLSPGTVVSGIVRVDGRPAGQVKVSCSSQPAKGEVADPTSPTSFADEVITDNEGRFVFPKRFPPGTYEVQAARQTLENPIAAILDFQKTKQTFQLQRGLRDHRLTINIDTRD